MNIMQKAGRFVEKNASTILSIFAAVGVAGTGYLAARGAKKALADVDFAKRNKGEELTKWETIRASAPAYIPAVVVGTSTIACVFGANVLSRKQQAAMVSAYALLENSYKEYKKKFIEMYGEDAEAEVRHEIAKDKVEETHVENALPFISSEKHLFFEELSGEYFEATMEEILYAEYHFNRNFVLAGYAKLNQLYDWFNLPHTKAGDVLGWSLYEGEAFYGYTWIDFDHDKVTLDDGLECYIISMPFAPHADYEGWED